MATDREGTFSLVRMLVICVFTVRTLMQRGRGARAFGFALGGTPESQHLHKYDEDHAIRDASAMTAERTGPLVRGSSAEHWSHKGAMVDDGLVGQGALPHKESMIDLPVRFSGHAPATLLAAYGRKLLLSGHGDVVDQLLDGRLLARIRVAVG